MLTAPIAAVIAFVAWWCNRNVFGFLPDDLPRAGRKQHDRPIPLAGIALWPVLLVWLLADHQWLLAGGVTAVALVGFADDWCKERNREFDWRRKLLVLALAAAAVAGTRVDPFADPGRWVLAVAVVFVVTNATNFLDNTDGVAAALSAVGLLLGGGDSALQAAGWAALGFLPWNWPRPALFLGDSGAYALGLCAGAACVQRLGEPLAFAPFAPFALPLVDFVQVVCARLFLGIPPWIGDRRHLTHIAQNLGVPRRWVAPMFAVAAAAIALLAR